MKSSLTIWLLLIGTMLQAQKRQCGCSTDSFINGSVDCSVKRLSNGSELYWQINCKRVWLTLKKTNNKKIVLDEVPYDLYGYTFRLGFQLAKEYKKTLLFRSGCPANGPCNFILIDKNSGKRIKESGNLYTIILQSSSFTLLFIFHKVMNSRWVMLTMAISLDIVLIQMISMQ